MSILMSSIFCTLLDYSMFFTKNAMNGMRLLYTGYYVKMYIQRRTNVVWRYR